LESFIYKESFNYKAFLDLSTRHESQRRDLPFDVQRGGAREVPIDGPSDEEDGTRAGRLTVHELEEEEHLLLLHLPSSQPDEVEEPVAVQKEEGQRHTPEVVDLVEEEEEREAEEGAAEAEEAEEEEEEDDDVVIVEAAGKDERAKLS
jgi:hypothetical protein